MGAERTVDAYVAGLPNGQREIAEAVRRLVRSAAPEAREAFKWAQPVFESGGPFAYIKAFPRHVNFGFWRGVEVDGGRGVLETGGSKMAHIKCAGCPTSTRPFLRRWSVRRCGSTPRRATLAARADPSGSS